MLKLQGVSKHYQGFSLKNVSFELPDGMIMGLIGENGAGKTTCLSSILSMIHYEGKIEIFGCDTRNLSMLQKQDIGVVLDENCFADHMTISEIERVCASLFAKWDSNLFREYCTKYNLPLDKKIKEFSKGMKMKMNIFLALSHHPRLLILDEATSGLDPVARDELLDVFYEFVADGKHSILMSSHILSDIEKTADLITYISNGQVIFSEPKDDLLDKYVLVRCTEEELKGIDSNAILSVRRHMYGLEACVLKKEAGTLQSESANLDDIMVFASRAGREKA